MKLHVRMALGFALGAAAGGLAYIFTSGTPQLAFVLRYIAQPAGQIFLRLLFMLVIPMVFSALSLGIVGLGDLRTLGRVGVKTLAYTVVVSTIAVLLGVGLVNLVRPGDGMSPEFRQRLSVIAAERAGDLAKRPPPKAGFDMLVQIVPDNPVAAAANGDLLAVMFFSLMIGVGLMLTRTEAARRFQETLEGLYDVSMRLIGLVISFAPYGVAALMFSMTAQFGWEIFRPLAKYVFVAVLAMGIHQFGVYSLSVWWLGKRNPVQFFRDIDEAMFTAFSTASSNATLPTTLKVAEEELKLPRNVSRFVLTIGSTANQNGTALFEGVTALFLAQFYGVDLSLAQQLTVVFICILGGIGTAGVPAGSLPVVALILGMIGVPAEGIGFILGVDRFLDMCRTTLNVTGDLAAAVVVSRGETNHSN